MIYLDNSATSKLAPEVLDAMLPYLQEEYGNPSSKYYTLAKHAADAVETSRQQVARLIGARPEEIIFTSGSTESTNMIIKGVCDYKKFYEQSGSHIITSKVEHHATLNVCRFLNGEIYSNHDATFSLFGKPKPVDRGYSVTFLDVNSYGQVEPVHFEAAIKKDTVLASFIWANNEIGSLNDIDALCNIAHRHHVAFHTDGTQIVGKLPVDVEKTPIDFLSLSAHKFHGPKGIGAAYFRSDGYGIPPFTALVHGGEQEQGYRGGTLAVHNIVGMGKAAELAQQSMMKSIEKLERMEQIIYQELAKIQGITILGDPSNHLLGVISVVIHDSDFDNERFIKSMSSKFALSTGSACTAGMPSHVLQAIGRGEDVSRVLRISLSPDNSPDQVSLLLKEMKKGGTKR